MFDLNKVEAEELASLHSLMFEDDGRRPFSADERRRLNQLWEKQNTGKILPNAVLLVPPPFPSGFRIAG